MRTPAFPTARQLKKQATPEQLEKILASTDAIRAMPSEARRRAVEGLRQLRLMLQQTTCSQPWQDDCWREGASFPPPADTTPMLPCRCERCSRTGRVWPPHYGADDTHKSSCSQVRDSILSYECYLESLSDWEAAQLPSSPSGLALRAVREGRIKLRRQRTRLGSRRISG